MDKSTELVVVAHPLDPNIIQENNNTNANKRRNNEVSYQAAISSILKNANEDILLEIFLRLANSRSAILVGSVCRLWHALISQPRFVPRFMAIHHQHQSYTIFFRRCCGYSNFFEKPQDFQPVYKLFSNESLLLHGKRHATSASYFDFLPSPMVIMASFNDLLLMSPQRPTGQRYYICNPVTKQWFLIPGEVPHGLGLGVALICSSEQQLLLSNNNNQYNLVLIHMPRPQPGGPSGIHTLAAIYCSKSGQWTKSYFCYPRPAKNRFLYAYYTKIVTCNGILYWLDDYHYLERVLALDLPNSHCGVIHLPSDFVNHRPFKVHMGVVRGALRLLQICHIVRSRDCFLMKIWELNYREDNSWVSIHEGNLIRPYGDAKMVSVTFHPLNFDVVFVVWGLDVFEYGISNNTRRKVGELPVESTNTMNDSCFEPFTLVHPAWPSSPVPSHHPPCI